MMRNANRRLVFVALAVITIALGLYVHRFGGWMSTRSRDFAGDALWAMMIVWWVSAIVPQLALTTRAIIAAMVCYAVELSQLYHGAAIDALRAAPLGHLVLGSGFDSRDLLAYTLGIVVAATAERLFTKARS